MCVHSGNFSIDINATSVLAPTLANLTALNCSWHCDTLQPVDCMVSSLEQRASNFERYLEASEETYQEHLKQLQENARTGEEIHKKVEDAWKEKEELESRELERILRERMRVSEEVEKRVEKAQEQQCKKDFEEDNKKWWRQVVEEEYENRTWREKADDAAFEFIRGLLKVCFTLMALPFYVILAFV